MGDAIQEVLPGELRLPPSRAGGADPWKLHQQIRQFGASTTGMPPILVYRDPDDLMEIIDGVTRAVRIAKLAPQQPVPVISIGQYRRSRASFSSCKGPRMSDDNARTELFDALRDLAHLMPEMRCAQLIAAIGEVCADLHGRGLWDASDAEFLEAIWQFRRNYEAAITRSGSPRRPG